jgi:hypothetical protein
MRVKEIKNSSAAYVRCSVYDALPKDIGTFDLVLYAGVYYHLKNPVLSLQRIRGLLKDDGVLFIEGASCTDHLAAELTEKLGLRKSAIEDTARLIDALPIAYFDAHHKIYKNWSNWWFPTAGCLEELLRDSGFRNIDVKLRKTAFTNYTDRRLLGRAEADPAKADPAAQNHEHVLATGEETAAPTNENFHMGRFERLVTRLPRFLRPVARRIRSIIRSN